MQYFKKVNGKWVQITETEYLTIHTLKHLGNQPSVIKSSMTTIGTRKGY